MVPVSLAITGRTSRLLRCNLTVFFWPKNGWGTRIRLTDRFFAAFGESFQQADAPRLAVEPFDFIEYSIGAEPASDEHFRRYATSDEYAFGEDELAALIHCLDLRLLGEQEGERKSLIGRQAVSDDQQSQAKILAPVRVGKVTCLVKVEPRQRYWLLDIVPPEELRTLAGYRGFAKKI